MMEARVVCLLTLSSIALGCGHAERAASYGESLSADGQRTITIAGPETMDAVVRARAMLDFDCPSDQVRPRQVATLSGRSMQQRFFVVQACGREARYACFASGETYSYYCLREPLDAPPTRSAPGSP